MQFMCFLGYSRGVQTSHRYRYVITGGPGFGNSSLIGALAERGYATAPESARLLIRELVARQSSALPWLDRAAFQALIVPRRIEDYHAVRDTGLHFFDRGLPDEIAYYQKDGLMPSDLCLRACADYRYDAVFVVPPWEAIYTRDAERTEDFAEATRIHEAIVDAYTRLGYDLIEIPRATLEDRVAFVLSQMSFEQSD